MLKLVVTKAFRKDMKKIGKQRKNIAKIDAVVQILLNNHALPDKYKDHALIGKYKGYRDCHIDFDWVLIYKVDEIEVTLVRTGSHSEVL